MNYINKNILLAFEQGGVDVLLHQENCVSKGYAGIAKLIHDKYPSTLPRENRKFGMIEYAEVEESQYIVNMYSQFYPGSPNNSKFAHYSGYLLEDNFENRINALKKCLSEVKKVFNTNTSNFKIGIPLIASGLARKNGYQSMSDLEYFKTFIAPVVEEILPNVTVYYL
jgi:hypothetical protein